MSGEFEGLAWARIRRIARRSLEVELHRELELARIAKRARDLSEGGRIRHARRGEVVVRPVEYIESLNPEFEAPAGAEREVPEQGHVHRLGAWPAHRVESAVPVGERGRLRECGRVEPLLDGLIESARQWIADAVRAGLTARAGIGAVGRRDRE